jgi:hypothetical protein
MEAINCFHFLFLIYNKIKIDYNMKYLQLFENTASVGNAEVQFTSKNQKLDELMEQINALLSTMGDKKIGYNYSVGSKGIYYTNSEGKLVSETGFACTTYSELLSNLEVILFTFKHINANPISVSEEPIEMLPVSEPTNDIKPDVETSDISELPGMHQLIPIEIPIQIPIVDDVKSFTNFGD